MCLLKNPAVAYFVRAIKRWNLTLILRAPSLFCDLIHEAYESAAKPICKVLVPKIAETWMLVDENTPATSILNLIESFPDLGKDLATHMSKPISDIPWTSSKPATDDYNCPLCCHDFTAEMDSQGLYCCRLCGHTLSAQIWKAHLVQESGFQDEALFENGWDQERLIFGISRSNAIPEW